MNSFKRKSQTLNTTDFDKTAFSQAHNPMNDSEVVLPPNDSIAALSFSPPSLERNYLIAGSWDNHVRCWEVQESANTSRFQSIPKAQQTHQGPVLDVAWSDDGTRVFTASCDKTVHMWDLNSNQFIQVAQHNAAVKTVHWIKSPSYSCIMTGSWDKTLKFWDPRSPCEMLTINLPERCYCADVYFPMAVVGTASKGVLVYSLEYQPRLLENVETPLKYQNRCVAIFLDKKSAAPCGFALGNVEGRVAIQYMTLEMSKENFNFKCHRVNATSNAYQDIFAVNDMAFHRQHGTLATVGSDGRFNIWNKDMRTRLMTSEPMQQPITRCCFSAAGDVFAYAVGYDWSRGHEFYDPQMKNHIFLRSCYEECMPVTPKCTIFR